MIDKHLICVDEIEIICYGLEVVFLKIMHITLIVIVSFVFKGLEGILAIIVFLLPFFFLRSLCVGYHSKNRMKCLCISILISFLVSMLTPFLNNYLLLYIEFLGLIYLCKKCPIINSNNPLLVEEIFPIKRKIRRSLLLFFSISVFSCFTGFYGISKLICMAIIIVFVLAFIENKINKRNCGFRERILWFD